jgi:hypothetical protein
LFFKYLEYVVISCRIFHEGSHLYLILFLKLQIVFWEEGSCLLGLWAACLAICVGNFYSSPSCLGEPCMLVGKDGNLVKHSGLPLLSPAAGLGIIVFLLHFVICFFTKFL